MVTSGVDAAVPWFINANKFAEKLPAEYARSLSTSLPNDPDLLNAVQAANSRSLTDLGNATMEDMQKAASAVGFSDFFSGDDAPVGPADDVSFW